MSSSCKNKEAAIRFIDQFYNPEVSVQVLWGELDTCVEKVSDTEYSVLSPTDESTDPGTWKWTNTLADDGPMYISDNIKVNLSTDMVSNADDTTIYDTIFEQLDLDKNVIPFTFLKYSDEDNTNLKMVNTNIVNLCLAQFAIWVAEGGVDEQWEDYLKNVEAAGMDDGITIIQKYFDQYLENEN